MGNKQNKWRGARSSGQSGKRWSQHQHTPQPFNGPQTSLLLKKARECFNGILLHLSDTGIRFLHDTQVHYKDPTKCGHLMWKSTVLLCHPDLQEHISFPKELEAFHLAMSCEDPILTLASDCTRRTCQHAGRHFYSSSWKELNFP